MCMVVTMSVVQPAGRHEALLDSAGYDVQLPAAAAQRRLRLLQIQLALHSHSVHVMDGGLRPMHDVQSICGSSGREAIPSHPIHAMWDAAWTSSPRTAGA